MEKYYYLLLNLASFAVPFAFSFERKMMHFIRFWKPLTAAIVLTGTFFLLWDIFFAYQEVWSFNDQYLTGMRLFKLPLEEWLFFLLIPYASVFIHYSLAYFYPALQLGKKTAGAITTILLITSAAVAVSNTERLYTAVNFAVFATVLLLQKWRKWPYIRRFYLSFLLIYIPFYFVNSALTGSYSESPVVFYDNRENLGLRIGTMPVEDSVYCFSMLYITVLLFEYLRRRWGYSRQISVHQTTDAEV